MQYVRCGTKEYLKSVKMFLNLVLLFWHLFLAEPKLKFTATSTTISKASLNERVKRSEYLSFENDEGAKTFENYKLLRIKPRDGYDLEYLRKLYESVAYDLDFWQPPTHVGALVDVTVSPYNAITFMQNLDKREMDYYIVSENLQSLIEKERTPMLNYDSLSEEDLHYHYDRYNPLSTIERHLFRLREENPQLLKVYEIGKTYENRSIYTVKVHYPLNSIPPAKNETAIWIDAGIHAREWIAPATAMIILKKLIDGYHTGDVEMNRLVRELTWYITIVMNPDGYEYAHNKNRMWRKNRRPSDCKIDRNGNKVCCAGVDLNRNFDWHFSLIGASNDPCHETYHGPYPFSEPESEAVLNFLKKIPVQAFITLHSYSQLWLIPYGHKRNTYPDDYSKVLKPLAVKATSAMSKLYGTKYTIGTSADLLYEASGTSYDYAKGKLNIPYSFLIELRPQNVQYSTGFLLPESDILATGDETWLAIKVVANEVISKQSDKSFTHKVSTITTTHPPLVTKLAGTTIHTLLTTNNTSYRKRMHKVITEKLNSKENKTISIFPDDNNNFITSKKGSSSSESSGMEVIFMIEWKQGKKKKKGNTAQKERPSTNSNNNVSIESVEQLETIETVRPQPKFLSTTNRAPTKSITINEIFSTTPFPNTTQNKVVHCFDYSNYCKWWKIHGLCNKPQVKEKCNLSCAPECQI